MFLIILMWPLDRVNLTNRGDTYIVGTAAKALCHDVSTMTLSRSSIRRSHYRNRENRQQWIRSSSTLKLLLHWDGKLLPDITDSRESGQNCSIGYR